MAFCHIKTSYIYKCLLHSFKASLKRVEDGCGELRVCVCLGAHSPSGQIMTERDRRKHREREWGTLNVSACKTPTARKGTSLLHVISLSPPHLSFHPSFSPFHSPLNSLFPSLPSSLSPLSLSSHPLSPIYPSPSSPLPPSHSLSLPFPSLKQ